MVHMRFHFHEGFESHDLAFLSMSRKTQTRLHTFGWGGSAQVKAGCDFCIWRNPVPKAQRAGAVHSLQAEWVL